ncbi:NlpC/P60 family protein [Maritimibacter sp. UBA3975]|uniref:NlpC/P60 family protein n=1 Tax=Maritimibacter sp. UBA3975 TaxID=1946833 RepID=UPI000C0B20B1|nr:NlpC/P60 family protein [Maritimibacter sp. UBA3975]MAM61065.1 peptidase [Maritimibacter sp.]|tara:strand:- start:1203 stop:1640 length:438 start_codon:yes stop_codon:yes gene_type:complete
MNGAVVLAEARLWLGTPYRHQASCRGAGADCLGLVRGVWRALYGREPVEVPAYTPDWSEPARDEVLMREARALLCEVPAAEAAPGDVLLFRMREGAVAKHLGILAQPAPEPSFLHAYSGHGVVESSLSAPWQRRIVGTFRFPERG